MTQIYSEDLTVSYYDLDVSGRVKPSALLRIANVVSDNHCKVLNVGYSQLRAFNYAFIITRLSMFIHVMPEYDQSIKVRTWSVGIDGPAFVRNGEILDESLRVMASWSGTWGLADIARHKFARPSMLPTEVQHAGELGGKIRARRLSHPDEKLREPPREHAVSYRDVDYNGHVNNTAYLDIIMDALPFSVSSSLQMEELHINYVNEARVGDVLDIKWGVWDDEILFKGLVKDSVCFQAAVKKAARA
ncbi:acyl-ACP thioesterase [Clostridia bacterium]|nr:acyl-ACP thioesterase [Clostridia bacterium]